MKFIKLLLPAAFAMATLMLNAQPPIIPAPKHYKALQDSFLLNNDVAIVFSDKTLADEAQFLQKELLKRTGISVAANPAKKQRSIQLVKTGIKSSNAGAYYIKMSGKTVVVSAAEEEGVFNGIVSMLQLVSSGTKHAVVIKSWEIKDEPLYPWRGLMLDESRHFFGKEKVKSILDWMAFYKLNKFHWHLTDTPGWRIEIKKYPLLSVLGGIGSHSNQNSPAAFYTQEDVKEIVAYAAERKIEVIPEIDMPGHARAANRAYPQYSGGGSAKYPDFTFDPGNEGTYAYLSDIIREVDVLFPSKKIHLGGDEVSFGNQQWGKNPAIQRLMNTEKLESLKDVEDYFMLRMADTLFKLNSTFLAWDEMANLSLPADKTIILWWRHDQPKQLEMALNKNYKVVLCPRIPLYFDFVQDSTHNVGRKWRDTYAGLKSVYSFSDDNIVAKNKQKNVLGIQANVWTEVIATPERLEYMLFPRIGALSEAAWSEKRDYDNFLQRLKNHLGLYDAEDIYYYNPFDPMMNSELRK